MASRTNSEKRKQIIQLLVAFSVNIPLSTKLPDEELERRLRHAINASQSADSIISPVKIGTLPKWGTTQPDADGSVLRAAMLRRNVDELAVADASRKQRRLAHVGLEFDLFANLCNIFGLISSMWTQGDTTMVMEGQGQNKMVVAMRVGVAWYKSTYISAEFFARC